MLSGGLVVPSTCTLLLRRWFTTERLIEYGTDPAAAGMDEFAFVKMLATCIYHKPALLTDPRFGECLLLALRMARRVVVDREDELGDVQHALLAHRFATLTATNDLVRAVMRSACLTRAG